MIFQSRTKRLYVHAMSIIIMDNDDKKKGSESEAEKKKLLSAPENEVSNPLLSRLPVLIFFT